MKAKILILPFLFVFTIAYSQKLHLPPTDTISCNEILAPIFPRGAQFYGNDMPTYLYPKTSTKSPLYTFGLWIGGMFNDELHLAADKYYQNGRDFWSGPYTDAGSNSLNSAISTLWYKSWKVTKVQINNHVQNYSLPGYQMPECISSWPAHGNLEYNQAQDLAPFVDVDSDGVYHPESGDYPLIKGDASVFYIINDNREHTESEGKIMGVEIHCMAWAMNQSASSVYNTTIFFSYKIINRSENTYQDTYLGVFADFDIGKSDDDYIGCHVENGNFYGYNADDFDGPEGYPYGYRDTIPSQACCILSGPNLDADHIDNPSGECNESINGSGFDDGIIDNERFGMNRFVAFSSVWNDAMTDPRNDTEFYNYMKGFWKDGSPILYGGNGHSSSGATGPETRFVFMEDSDSCHWSIEGEEPHNEILWSEYSAGNQPQDIRGLASMGPFTFEAGSTHYLDLALVTAPSDLRKNSKDLLQDYAHEVRVDYLKNPLHFGDYNVGLEEDLYKETLLEIYPNPINGDFVYFDLPESNSASYKIYNAAGQLVLSGQLPSQKLQDLFVGDLESGWYILEVQSGNKIFRSKLIK
ncbi:T9SS type A sorting domain-containing protein [Lentimicrobium sp. S6]|uniref:T9SS type A sorting domain-containing protein n=1 Tax=Lentimicrobium sp. S6 TaxID=2735872 RepID=UPI0015573F9D|nr:T9SS type A sorting domain-containing protein [Lentimicrobium sp. S6]NPD46324.1 T9SS type A sorting domain-containing protein [Lentimicrobium sp. S6]